MQVIIYGIGVLSLFLCDFLVTKSLGTDQIALWAEIRSLIGIGGVICLVGLEQVLVRSPQSSARLLRMILIQTPLIALILGLMIWKVGFLGDFWVAACLVYFSAINMALFQYFRSNRLRISSQIAWQGWKIVAFLLLVMGVSIGWIADVRTLILIAFSIAIAVSMYSLRQNPPSTLRTQQPDSVSALYFIGVRFMLSALMLALAVYGEQLIVARIGTAADTSLYFTHAAYFLFPISLLNGYLAFVSGPVIRDDHANMMRQLYERKWWLISGIIAAVLIAHAVGRVGWEIVVPKSGSIDLTLSLIMLLSCFARTFYTLPSTYLGVFATPRQHDVLLIGQILILAASILFLIVLLQSFGLPLLHAVAAASATNWIARTILGYALMSQVFRVKVDNA